ncbi:MAG: hypothetical protein V1859_02755 [archaeon]
MDTTQFLSALVILLIGLACYFVTKKTHYYALFMIALGIVLGFFKVYLGLAIPTVLLEGISAGALLLFSFLAGKSLIHNNSDTNSRRAFKEAIIILPATIVTVFLIAENYFGLGVVLSLVLSIIILALDYYELEGKASATVYEIYYRESIIIRPVVLILPTLIFLVFQNIYLQGATSGLINAGKTIFLSIGIGIFLSLISIYFMKRHSSFLSFFSVIIILGLCYFASSILAGYFFIAAFVFGIFFANFEIPNRTHREKGYAHLMKYAEALVLLITGYIAYEFLSFNLFSKSLSIFFAALAIRTLGIFIAHKNDRISNTDKLVLSFYSGKSMAASVIIISLFFNFASNTYIGFNALLAIVFFLILLSEILSVLILILIGKRDLKKYY